MKIVKFFVVFNLILSISLINSVAAISVSDGSAFVTKAEFAADLNNLSNRMSTLENSLDAKIDSLVSSYLSRNGIWNGEKHEILSFKDEAIWSNSWAINQTSNEVIENKNISLTKITKSGLLNLKFKLTGANNEANSVTAFGTLYFVYSSHTNVSDPAKAVVTFKYRVSDEISATSQNTVYEKILTSTTFNSANYQGRMVGYLMSYTADDFFFVSKDMNLAMNMIVITEGNNWSNSLFKKDTNKASYINPKLKIESLTVY